MNTSADTDRLHLAWQALDRQVARHNDLLLQQSRRSGMQSLRRRLRPLAWGQTVQMLMGIALILVAVPIWTTYHELPHVLASGLILHAYGVLAIAFGGITLGMLSTLDYASPVLAIQTRLLQLQKLYIGGSATMGLAWWLLWIPFATVVFAWAGVDFQARVAPAMPWMIATGCAGLLGTWLFDRWARGRPALYAKLRTGMAGPSLAAANAELARLRELEQD